VTQLVKYDAAKKALAEAKRVDEVLKIEELAKRMAAYARQAKDTQMIQDATELRQRAERRLGQMLEEAKQKGERRADRNKGKNWVLPEPSLTK
jgi:K+/H+ antiporter YhaU regulatory subunit KhtT